MENFKDTRIVLTILGRNIGSYEYWEQADTAVFQFYKFIPREGVNLPETECITIDYLNGKASHFLGEADIFNEESFDLVEAINHIKLGK